MRLIIPSQRIERASLCPNCGKPQMRRAIPRRQRLPSPRRHQIGDRFRSQLLNMAAGDVLLDAAGNVRLDASGNVILSNGLGDSCCCGSGSATCCGSTVLVTFSGFNATGNTCSFAPGADLYKCTGTLDGLSVCCTFNAGACTGQPCEYAAYVTACGFTVDADGVFTPTLVDLRITLWKTSGWNMLATMAPSGEFGCSGSADVNLLSTFCAADSALSCITCGSNVVEGPDDCSTHTITFPDGTGVCGQCPDGSVTLFTGGTVTVTPGGC